MKNEKVLFLLVIQILSSSFFIYNFSFINDAPTQ